MLRKFIGILHRLLLDVLFIGHLSRDVLSFFFLSVSFFCSIS